MKYIVDISLVNKLVDGFVHADELPKDGSFVASQVQIDELNRTKNAKRRSELLQRFSELVDELLPTESSVFEISRFDLGKFGDGVAFGAIKLELDSLNGGKKNNSEDALIAEVAMKNGYVLLTADYDLYHVAYTHGIGTMYWTTPRRRV